MWRDEHTSWKVTGSTSVFQLRNATTYLDRFKEGKKGDKSYFLLFICCSYRNKHSKKPPNYSHRKSVQNHIYSWIKNGKQEGFLEAAQCGSDQNKPVGN